MQALVPLVYADGWLLEPPMMFEPSDFIWRSHESLQALTHTLAWQPLPILLERLPASSPTLDALRRAFALRGRVIIGPAMPTPVIKLEGRGMDCNAWFNAGRRSDFRRMQRLAENFGAVSYEIHAPDNNTALTGLLDEAYAVEALSWKAAAGTALTTDTTQGNFFVSFCRTAARENILRIAFMRINGHAVAMQIACEWQQRFWLFKISYDQAFARCSPGQLLLRHTLQHSATTGLRSYELMGVMDDWTKLWTTDTRDYVHVRAIPFSHTLKMFAKNSARKIINRLRMMPA